MTEKPCRMPSLYSAGRLSKMRKISISPSACAMAALTILLLPLRWIFAAFFAAAFHEICHILAVYLCGGRIQQLTIGDRGAVMYAKHMPIRKSILCVLAGPLGSLLLVLLLRWMPRVAICGLFHGIYNLLPIYPLDGGRAIRCICSAIKNRP